jgi:hypothetical protein
VEADVNRLKEAILTCLPNETHYTEDKVLGLGRPISYPKNFKTRTAAKATETEGKQEALLLGICRGLYLSCQP